MIMTSPSATLKTSALPNTVQEMQERIKTLTHEKDANAAKGKELDEKLRRAFKTPPKRPNISIEHIDTEMTRLEHRRNTTSMSLNDEKFILRELQLLKEKKTQVQTFADFQTWVDTTKQERTDRFQQHRKYEEELQQLQQGMKKVSLAAKFKCAVDHLESVEVVVPDDRMGSVIGKGGATAQRIEEECGVLVDVDHKTHVVSITGPPANILEAKMAIENITLATIQTLGLHPDTIKVLMAQKGKALHELEQKLHLKIDINKVDGVLTVLAAPTRMKQLEKAINEVAEGKVEISLPSEIVPKLIGKKGETINQLMEDTGCLVDIDKVTNAVRLCGTKESVAMAKKFVKELIDEQSLQERVFTVHDTHIFSSPDFAAFKFYFFAEFLMANKAAQLKLLRTDASDARIKVSKEQQQIEVAGNKVQLQTMVDRLYSYSNSRFLSVLLVCWPTERESNVEK